MRRFLLKNVNLLGSIASIVGLCLVFVVNKPWQGIVALAVVVVFLGAILVKVILTLNQYAQAKYPRGYSVISTQIRYSTSDGNKIRYEVYRHIQCRRAWMTEFDYAFKWTGSKPPVISAN